MLHRLSELLGGIPIAGVVALGVLLLVQLVLQIVSLVDLSRRAVVPGRRKWVWALVIIFGNLLGVILYFAVGRAAVADADEAQEAGSPGARDRAIDRLYGDGRDR